MKNDQIYLLYYVVGIKLRFNLFSEDFELWFWCAFIGKWARRLRPWSWICFSPTIRIFSQWVFYDLKKSFTFLHYLTQSYNFWFICIYQFRFLYNYAVGAGLSLGKLLPERELSAFLPERSIFEIKVVVIASLVHENASLYNGIRICAHIWTY